MGRGIFCVQNKTTSGLPGGALNPAPGGAQTFYVRCVVHPDGDLFFVDRNLLGDFRYPSCVSRAGWRRRQFTPLPGLDGKVGGQFRVLIILGELARDWLMHSKFVVRLKILLAQLKIRRRGVGRTFYGLGGE